MKETKKRKRISKLLIILLSIVFVIFLTGVSAVIWDAPAREELKNLIINEVDFGSFNDGVYTGEYHGTKNNLRDAAVEVTVESGAVTKIMVIEVAAAGDSGSGDIPKGIPIDDLFRKVINDKSLQVDAIGGATLTTNAYLKAIENALLKAQIK
jgi:uncharacterized protein with FMN-binding domain